MRNHRCSRIVLSAVALLGLATACSDAPATAPADVAPSLSTSSPNSYTESQTMVGDTTVTVFVVGSNVNSAGNTFAIGNTSKITFPYAAGSICDPATSSYGPGTWDSACAAATTPIRITAKSWVNAQGKIATDFQPALRFVPGLRKAVTLTLKDAALAGTRIDYCTPSGCVNEALADPSLTTVLDPNNGFAYRIIKHFSGYTVTAD